MDILCHTVYFFGKESPKIRGGSRFHHKRLYFYVEPSLRYD